MKKIIKALALFILCVGLVACSSNTKKEETTIRIGVPTAPPTLPLLRMMETNALGDNVNIELDIWNEPESLIAMVQDKEHDMFAFPLTVVSTLHNKGMDVKLMNVNTWGVTYFLTSNPDFKTWSDLKGKTIYVPLQSSPPDALTQYFLKEAGLEVGKDVKIKYAGTTEIATLLGSGEAEYATLIEPQVTNALSKNKDLRVALSFEEEWQKTTKSKTMIPNAGFGTNQAFIDKDHKLVEDFQKEYKKALEWIKANPKETGVLAKKHLKMSPELVEKAIPTMGLEFKSAKDAKEELQMFYELLHKFNPKMTGGSVPSSDLYYDEK